MKKTSLFFAFVAFGLFAKSQSCPSLTYNGKRYSTIQIGGQCWMAENLNDNSHTEGSSGTYGEANDYLTADEKKCVADKYGRYYNWAAAMSIDTKIDGWHLPPNAEWDLLTNVLGGYGSAGAKMKVGGSSGFNALLAGFLHSDGHSGGIGNDAMFWSSMSNGSGDKRGRSIYSGDGYLLDDKCNPDTRISVRLLKD